MPIATAYIDCYCGAHLYRSHPVPAEARRLVAQAFLDHLGFDAPACLDPDSLRDLVVQAVSRTLLMGAQMHMVEGSSPEAGDHASERD